jgi:uncharacterized protein (DUF1330 family)
MTSIKTVLAGLSGMALGAAGVGALHAQSAPPAFLVANIQAVKDQATYDKYRAAVAATQVAYGGRFLARGAKAVMLDASPTPQGTIVIISFPNMKALQEWWKSPEYSAIRPLREIATVSTIYAVEGLPLP